MSDRSKIEWTDATWNPVTGCTPVSEGCANCYAKRMATRLRGRFGYPADDPFRVTLHPERLEEPFRWRKPRRVFVCSMGDLFHEDVPDDFLDQIFAVMAFCTHHTFLILTKRPQWMADYVNNPHTRERIEPHLEEIVRRFGSRQDIWNLNRRMMAWTPLVDWPLSNVWLGVSAENQARADERIPILLQTPAAVRFVSVEPMLQCLLIKWWLDGCFENGAKPDWVICGGETGPGARPMHPDWPRKLRDDCQAAGVAFFLKQMEIDGKLVKMPELDGRRWDELPCF